MHKSVMERFAAGLLTAQEVEGQHVLEVGSADVNGSVRPLVEALNPASYSGVDFAPGKGVDAVVDAERLTDDIWDTFGVVISTEMLEHVRNWKVCLQEMTLILEPDGLLVLTTRGPGFPYHPFPEDHWRFTVETMRRAIEALGLTPLVCEPDDPKWPGVIVKARKPEGWTPVDIDLDGIEALPASKESNVDKSKPFLVKPEHGRVKRTTDRGWVLVAVPGDTITYELAEECGLIDPPTAPEAEKPEVEETDEAPAPVKPKRTAKKATTASYPTKSDKK